MKLITEHLDSDIGYITEGVGAEKKTFVEGVGIVTKPGLGLEIGKPAINPVPKKMMR